MWAGWPSHPDLWRDDLEPARSEIAAMIKALAEGQAVKVAAMGGEAVRAAKSALPVKNVEIFDLKFGDIWLRDTGPVFTADGKALRFRNNGWGGKYALAHDDMIGDDIANAERAEIIRHDFILEGGALEHDGAGAILTTRECVLNANRNGWGEKQAESALKNALGAKRILWLDKGMVNDHTDGHIDNIVRFVAPGTVLCQSPFGNDDPNAELYEEIYETLKGFGLKVLQIPSPGLVTDENGEPVPASHMNFIIGNGAVVVPVYGTESAAEAVSGIQKIFPSRKVVGLPSRAVLTGGGSFHCMTQQVPG